MGSITITSLYIWFYVGMFGLENNMCLYTHLGSRRERGLTNATRETEHSETPSGLMFVRSVFAPGMTWSVTSNIILALVLFCQSNHFWPAQPAASSET